MIFSPRGTAEHRLHTATLNGTKIINWLFICNAIVKYAEKNIDKIVTTSGNIPLKEVINYYQNAFPKDENAAFLSEYLNAYYNYRKKVFDKDVSNGDRISKHEIIRDKDYSFEYKGIAGLV